MGNPTRYGSVMTRLVDHLEIAVITYHVLLPVHTSAYATG